MSKWTDNINYGSAAQYAQKIANKYGLTLTSAHRSSAKDKAVGGSGRGYHVLGQAYDLAGSVSNMDKAAVELKASKQFRSVLWRVAGHYDHIHVSWNKQNEIGGGNVKDGTVAIGDKGGIVETIQDLLNVVTIDGIFGKNTEYAVKEFQKDNGLTVDGIVGKNTWEGLTKGGYSLFFS